MTRKLIHFTLGAFALISLVSNVGCDKSSGSGGGGETAAAAAVTLTLAPSPATVAAGGTVMLTPGGGTAPYTFTVVSTGGGTLSLASGTYTVFTAPAVAGIAEIQVTDAAASTAYFAVTITGSASALNVTPLNSSLAASGTLTFSASGGTAPYTFTASAGTFSPASTSSSTTYYAPAATGVVTITVTDSVGNTTSTELTLTASAAAASCEGNYALNLDGAEGTMYIIEDASGNIAGALSIDGSSANFYGTCVNGNINFVNSYSGSQYTGTYFIDPQNTAITVLSGTYTGSSGTFQWFAETN